MEALGRRAAEPEGGPTLGDAAITSPGETRVLKHKLAELRSGIGAQLVGLGPEPGDLRRHVDNLPITYHWWQDYPPRCGR